MRWEVGEGVGLTYHFFRRRRHLNKIYILMSWPIWILHQFLSLSWIVGLQLNCMKTIPKKIRFKIHSHTYAPSFINICHRLMTQTTTNLDGCVYVLAAFGRLFPFTFSFSHNISHGIFVVENSLRLIKTKVTPVSFGPLSLSVVHFAECVCDNFHFNVRSYL